jgi:hypothetical protein
MAALQLPRTYSVKHGPPSKTQIQVQNYMSQPDRQLLQYPPDPLDVDQKINVDLLQIISKGINDIVDNLKMRLGNSFSESNANAAAIKDLLDNLKTGIDADIAVINQNQENKITLDNDNNLIYNNNFYREDLRQNFPNVNIGYDTINIQPNANFTTLDSNNINVVQNQETLINPNDSTINAVNTRLKNCQNLEFLYLKKHDEIMRIFAFTINLFDKYKYAIKVILFLLKHLVYKDRADGTPPISIQMPLPIITNIKKLVTDQKNIQGVIDRMKVSIMPEKSTTFPNVNVNVPNSDKLATLIPNLSQTTFDKYLTNPPDTRPPSSTP